MIATPPHYPVVIEKTGLRILYAGKPVVIMSFNGAKNIPDTRLETSAHLGNEIRLVESMDEVVCSFSS